MSITILQSGDSNAFKAAVDKDGRLSVRSLRQSFDERAVELGDAYNLNTGNITLTSGSASGMSYLKNNTDEVIIISSYIYLFGNTDGGATENGRVEIIENPTPGS